MYLEPKGLLKLLYGFKKAPYESEIATALILYRYFVFDTTRLAKQKMSLPGQRYALSGVE
jgi:hypothetical protein